MTLNNNFFLSITNKYLLTLILVFVLILVLNIPVVVTLWRHGFDDGTYSHAFLIPFISLYLYYQLSITGKLQFREKISLPFTLLLIACSYLFFITTQAQISLGYWSSFLLVCLASLPMIYKFNWPLLFPTAFLIFIFPFWGVLTPILQDISVVAVTFIMGFTGVPTYVQGQFITIPAGVFEIAGGCSGLRYLIVSLAISSLFIYLYISNTKRALMFFIVAILGALLTNWIRITALILIGQYTNMESSLMEDHNTFGWYLYIPFMFLLFNWGNRLADTELFNPEDKINQMATLQQIPNKIAFFSLMGLLTLASTTLTSQSITSENVANNILAAEIEDKKERNNSSEIGNEDDNKYEYQHGYEDNIKPNIHYYSLVEKVISTHTKRGNHHYIFHFNGSDLDGKPSFYNNDFIPKGWQITAQSLINGWQVYTVYKNQRNAQVFVKYEIAGKTTPQVKTFKIRRLLESLKGDNKTHLHWKFYLCDKPCKTESL